MLFASLIGFSSVTLKWFGVISVESVLTLRYGTRDVLLGMIGLVLVYVLAHRVLLALLITPPEHYGRALLLSIFTVQITQIFFGWTLIIANLVLIAAGYTTLIAVASDAGLMPTPTEELWTPALYGIGLLLYVALQGRVSARMGRLVAIFQRAQEGDFSVRYDEDSDQMPDPVNVIGRAYNQMRERLQTIVLTDPLSGCYNRRGLNQLAEREVSRAIRQKKELAVLAIDLDHFKRINDDYGHLTGDEVLREVGALILADRVMQAFRQYRFRSLPPDVRITVSVGVAADWARDDDVAKTLLARADEALYVAKRNGRDQAVVWHAGVRAFDGTPPKGRTSVAGMLRVED